MTVAVASPSAAAGPARADAAAPAGKVPAASVAFGALLGGLDPSATPAAGGQDSADAGTATDTRRDGKTQRRPGDEPEDVDALLAMTGLAMGGAVAPAAPRVADSGASAKDGGPAVSAAAPAASSSPALVAPLPPSPTPPPTPPDGQASAAAADPAIASAMAMASSASTAPAPSSSRSVSTRPAATAPASSTADALSARVATLASADRARAKANGGGDTETVGDADPPGDSPTIAIPPAATPQTPTVPTARAGDRLAAGPALAVAGADRQLDLARGNAWIDGLARDIAATADGGGTLRFQLSPERLGNLQVEVTRGDDGAAVRMTTATVAAQAILADAKPQLLAQAHSHGLHISQATVDLGGGAASGGNGGASRDGAGQTPDGGSTQQQGGSRSGYAAAGGQLGDDGQSRRQGQPENLYQAGVKDDSSARESRGRPARDRDAGYA